MEDVYAVHRKIIEELPEEMQAIEVGNYNEVLDQLPYTKLEEIGSSVLSYESIDSYIAITPSNIYYKPKYIGRTRWYKLLNKLFKGEYWADIKIEIRHRNQDYWYYSTPLTTDALHKVLKRVRRHAKALHNAYVDTLRKEKEDFNKYVYSKRK